MSDPDVETRLALLEAKQKENTQKLDKVLERVNQVHLDIHAAKVAGRLVIALTLALAAFVGWLVRIAGR